MMQRIEGRAIEEIRSYFEEAARLANEATCLRAKCGSVIVATSGEIIGRGYNAPPQNDESQRRCNDDFDCMKKPKYDKTCCVHAEWNAVIDACKTAPKKLDSKDYPWNHNYIILADKSVCVLTDT